MDVDLSSAPVSLIPSGLTTPGSRFPSASAAAPDFPPDAHFLTGSADSPLPFSAAAEPTPASKANAIGNTSGLVGLNPETPAWMVDGYNHITLEDLGPNFVDCINLWVKFEASTSCHLERRVSPSSPKS